MAMCDIRADSFLRMIPPSITKEDNVYKLEIKGEYFVLNESLKHSSNTDVGAYFQGDVKRYTRYCIADRALEKLGISIKTKTYKFLTKYRSKNSSTFQQKLRNNIYFIKIDVDDITETPESCISMLSAENSIIKEDLINTRKVLGDKTNEELNTRKIPDPKPFHCATNRTKSRHLQKIMYSIFLRICLYFALKL